MKDDIKANKSGFMENAVNGEKTFSAYTPIEQVHDWYLVTSVPTDVIAENGNIVMKIFTWLWFRLYLSFGKYLLFCLEQTSTERGFGKNCFCR